MEYTLIYEALADNQFPVKSCLLFAILWIGLICLLVIFFRNKRPLSEIIFFSIIFAVVSIVLVSIISGYYSTKYIYDDYTCGKYLVAEGIIENYECGEPNNLSPDYFTIDGVLFSVGPSTSRTGFNYQLRQCDGSPLREGQMCIIYYVKWKFQNVIMKIQFIDN